MIRAVVLDWAGTTVDYGSFAPVDAFFRAFAAFGLHPTIGEVRAPMGLSKKAHIAKMLEGHPHTQADIDQIYADFEAALFEVLALYADPLPGVVDTVAELRELDVVIGSTTGYTGAMMEVVAPAARDKGYAPDCIVCPDETAGIGRPYPYMLWRNLERMGVASIDSVIKVGDTVADIEEARNAGCLSVGVLKGSSVLGVTQGELASATPAQAEALVREAEQTYLLAGADYVIDDITVLPSLLVMLNQKEMARV